MISSFKSAWLIILLLATAPMPAGGQTCNTNMPLSKPDSRYTDNGDGTVTDSVTGLMWMQHGNCIASQHPGFDNDNTAGDGAVTWQHALQFAEAVNAGTYDCGLGTTYNDWRLPNRNELASLVESACIYPAINENYLFSTYTNPGYWSSTQSAVLPSRAWYVKFDFGASLELVDKSTIGLLVRLVRDAP